MCEDCSHGGVCVCVCVCVHAYTISVREMCRFDSVACDWGEGGGVSLLHPPPPHCSSSDI